MRGKIHLRIALTPGQIAGLRVERRHGFAEKVVAV
jgi:hypothetical protein